MTNYIHPSDENLRNLHKAMGYDNDGLPSMRVSMPINILDAFGRFRTSQPFTLFDSQHRYKDNEKWSVTTATNGSSTHVADESVIDMAVTTESGSKVIRESKRVFPYQPGKTLLIMTTFTMSTLQENLRQRIGLFGSDNGIYLETDGTTVYLVRKSQSLGTTVRVPQNEWNMNKFDGSGAIDRVLDLTKANIFWIDVEWLGVGDVRCGFIVDGALVTAHIFHHDNEYNTTYMTTACLPLRYEIENLGTTATSSTLKQICSTVISEGGYEPKTQAWCATRTTAIASVAVGSWAPVVSIRMASGRTDAIVIPVDFSIVGTGNGAVYECALIRNATITGGSWTTHATDTNVEYNITSTSMSGGTQIANNIFTSSNQIRQVLTDQLTYNFEMQLGRDQTPTSDTLTLAVRHLLTGGNVYGSLSWNDLV